MTSTPTETPGTASSPKKVAVRKTSRRKTGSKKTTARKTVTRRKTVAAPVVSHVEYLDLSFALDTSAKGTTKTDKRSGLRTNASRTSRFNKSRVYRTANDRVTIQDSLGEEYHFSISKFIQILERTRDLSITKAIPSFE